MTESLIINDADNLTSNVQPEIKKQSTVNITFEGIDTALEENMQGSFSKKLTDLELSSAKYKLLVCFKLTDKTDIAKPSLRKFMDSLLTSLRYTDFLIFDFLESNSAGKHSNLMAANSSTDGKSNNFLETSSDVITRRLKYHDKTALFFKRRTQSCSFKETKSKSVKQFGTLKNYSKNQGIKISLPEGVYGCNIIFSTDKALANQNGFPAVIVEMPNEDANTKRSTAKFQYITFNTACDSKSLSRRIYKAVTSNDKSLVEKCKMDCFPLCNLLNLSFASISKSVDIKKNSKAFTDVICSAILDDNVTLLAELYELSLGREQYIRHLSTALLKLSEAECEKLNLKNITEKLEKCTTTVELVLPETISSTEKGILLLFLSSLLSKQFKVSLFYWTMLNNLIANALVAHHLLTQLEENEKNPDMLKKIEKYKIKYMTASNVVLHNCYLESGKSTDYILVEQIPYWNYESCISLARTTENEEFLNQEACRELNDRLWSSYKGNGSQFYKSSYTSTWSLTSPRIRFLLDLFGYMVFLMVYGILLVSQLRHDNVSYLEFAVMAYTLILFIREFDQWCYQGTKPRDAQETKTQKKKKCNFLSKDYLLDPFNMMDNISLIVAIIGWTCRFLAVRREDNHREMEAARYLLGLNFAIYTIRFLEFFYTSRSLGPIMVFIVNMLGIFIRYLLIIGVFLISFSVASESVLHPGRNLSIETFNDVFHIFHRGFWSTIGEYSLDDKDLPEKPRKYFVFSMLGCYALFMQILLFNLVICLFGEEIENRRSKWDAISNFLRLKQIMQYSTIRFILPPFLPLSIFLLFRSKDPYSIDLTTESSDLRYFETYAAGKHTSSIIEKNSFAEKVSRRRKVKNLTAGNENAGRIQSEKSNLPQPLGSKTTMLTVEPVQWRNIQQKKPTGSVAPNWQDMLNDNVKQLAFRIKELLEDMEYSEDSDNDDDSNCYENCRDYY